MVHDVYGALFFMVHDVYIQTNLQNNAHTQLDFTWN